ncbi:ArsA family ATPase, partial [Streptomyces sp. TRM76130]|nr:ArsA family ATPase [Streptomyces sp. TRM76130]
LVVAAPERDALREAAYFVQRLAAEDMPLAGLVLNRVHGSGADGLSAERALAAAENLEDAGIVDQRDGKAELRNSPDTHGGSRLHAAGTPTGDTEGEGSTGAAGTDTGTDTVEAPGTGTETTGDADGTGTVGDAEAVGDAGTDPERSVDRLAAGLLRLHADRMQLLSREQRTRDRFTALHPEVAVTEVAALPGDVHDLAGLRDIGDRLAAERPE